MSATSSDRPQLNHELLTSNFAFPENVQTPKILTLPEKVLQFGEGNFLRGFADWMIHSLNQQGEFQGKVVVAQPIERGLAHVLNEQEGLYTLILRGLQDGQVIEQTQIIESVSRALSPYENWQDFLACAENPELRVIISNTTEAGIAYLKEDFTMEQPLTSYPGKLTVFLYKRFQHFDGAADKGMLIMPCELIDRNGDNLKRIVLQLAEEWALPEAFTTWLKESNVFFNTLVDRIVTGYPHSEIEEYTEKLGYTDRLLDTGEIFHLWVIEGDSRYKEELPFHKAGLNVVWTDDMTPYRTRKVRVLNGSHTMTFAVALLYGLEIVRETVEHDVVGAFMRTGVFEEILPEVKLPQEEKEAFANSVLERYRNPFINHKWMDISLNSTSKFKARCLPTLLDSIASTGKPPKAMSFALAALMAFYKGVRLESDHMIAVGPHGEYTVRDDAAALKFFFDAWQNCDPEKEDSLAAFVKTVLGNEAMWGQDLNAQPGLHVAICGYLSSILKNGMHDTVNEIFA